MTSFCIHKNRIVYESIPWLVANGQEREAETILRKAAKVNNIKFPDRIFLADDQEYEVKEKKSIVKKAKTLWTKLLESSTKKEKYRISLSDMFRNTTIRTYLIVYIYIW